MIPNGQSVVTPIISTSSTTATVPTAPSSLPMLDKNAQFVVITTLSSISADSMVATSFSPVPPSMTLSASPSHKQSTSITTNEWGPHPFPTMCPVDWIDWNGPLEFDPEHDDGRP